MTTSTGDGRSRIGGASVVWPPHGRATGRDITRDQRGRCEVAWQPCAAPVARRPCRSPSCCCSAASSMHLESGPKTCGCQILRVGLERRWTNSGFIARAINNDEAWGGSCLERDRLTLAPPACRSHALPHHVEQVALQ